MSIQIYCYVYMSATARFSFSLTSKLCRLSFSRGKYSLCENGVFIVSKRKKNYAWLTLNTYKHWMAFGKCNISVVAHRHCNDWYCCCCVSAVIVSFYIFEPFASNIFCYFSNEKALPNAFTRTLFFFYG